MKKATIFFTTVLMLFSYSGAALANYSPLISELVLWEEDIEQFRELVFTKHAMFSGNHEGDITYCDNERDNIDWRSRTYPDLEGLPRLDGRQKKADRINNMLDTLIVALPSLTADQIMDELQRCLSVIGDNHSYAAKELTFSYPFRFLVTDDGYYCHDAAAEYEGLIYKKLISINGYSIDEIECKFSIFGSYDNIYDMRQRLSKGLNMPELLIALEIKNSPFDTDEYVFADEENFNQVSVLPKDIILHDEPMIHHSLYEREAEQAYWVEYWGETGVLYVKVNSFCDDIQTNRSINFDLINFCNTSNVQKVVFDVRNNKGGMPDSLRLFALYLQNHSYLNEQGRVFCLIDSTSLSAATIFPYEMKQLMNITIVGTPTGSRMHCFTVSGTEEHILKNSGYRITLAPGMYKGTLAHEATFPDVYISPAIDDLKSGVDPLVEYVKGPSYQCATKTIVSNRAGLSSSSALLD